MLHKSSEEEPYEEFHNIHREYDEERAALRFSGREHYPSLGHNDAFLLFLLLSLVVVAMILALKFGKGEELSKGVSTVLVVDICLFVLAYEWCTLCHLRWGIFVLFASLIVAMSIFVILLLTETK